MILTRYNLHRGILLVLISLFCLDLYAENHPVLPNGLKDIENELYSNLGKGNMKTAIESMKPQEYFQMKQYFNELATDPNPVRSKAQAEEILIEMGDQAAINRALRELLQNGRGEIFVYQHPKIVMAVAPLLSGNEPFTRDIYALPLSFRASRGIRQHLWRSPYYTQEVRDWAKTVNYSVFDSTDRNAKFERDAMRRWWKANRAAYLRGDYLAVKPGEPAPLRETPAPTPTAAMTPEETPIPSLASSTPKPRSTPIISPAPVPSGFPMFAVIALLAASIFLGGAYWLSKRKRK